ncbi:MAG: T9SS type A sorting domain-containing protein, partial [Bacteroidales bacterium]|nr:T9SS type A sorting domain-containing protein [Bacteroidales bacterium]
GISRGGGMTMNVASFHSTLDLPSFDALCAVVPGAGQSMAGIETTTKVIVLNGQENETNFNESQEAFDSLHHIPCSNKHLIQINSDYYGTPDLISEHNFAGSGHDPADLTALNALDFYGMWKFTVAVFDCAFKNQNCEYCFGRDTLVTYMGQWSDGTPVNPATIIDTCGNQNTGIIPNNASNSTFGIFPNPANTQIKLALPEGNYCISIFNNLGQKVFYSIEKCGLSTINVTDFSNGIYIIQATEKNKILTSKFVKQ